MAKKNSFAWLEQKVSELKQGKMTHHLEKMDINNFDFHFGKNDKALSLFSEIVSFSDYKSKEARQLFYEHLLLLNDIARESKESFGKNLKTRIQEKQTDSRKEIKKKKYITMSIALIIGIIGFFIGTKFWSGHEVIVSILGVALVYGILLIIQSIFVK